MICCWGETYPWRRILVDVFFSKQPSVNETGCSACAVGVQPHVPDSTRAQIPSVQNHSISVGYQKKNDLRRKRRRFGGDANWRKRVGLTLGNLRQAEGRWQKARYFLRKTHTPMLANTTKCQLLETTKHPVKHKTCKKILSCPVSIITFSLKSTFIMN